MKKIILFIAIIIAATNVFAQKDTKTVADTKSKTETIKTDDNLLETAKLALAAHGGDKFKTMKSLVIKGSVDITASNFPQAIPATFDTVYAGEKYRMEIKNPFQPFKQVYDGEQTLSNMQGGFNLPPLNRLGLPLLAKVGEKDFVVSALPEDKKKKKGFRLTAPDGFFTDFYLDEKTNQIKGYDSNYDINGRSVTTSVAIDKYRTIDGVVIPEKYVQRFDLGQMTIYAEFKAKEVLVNSELAADVFTLGK